MNVIKLNVKEKCSEEWKDIIEYEGLYQISNLGRVKSLKFNKEIILKPMKLQNGYLKVQLYKLYYTNPKVVRPIIRKLVHRLVLESFIGKSDLQCNHKNGIKTDNRLVNLEWITALENVRHSIKTGLRKN
jgi:hypothetical protein